MDFSQHEHKLKGLFVGGVALLLAVYLGVLVGTADYKPMLIGTVLAIGCYLWFFTGRFFWVLAIASSFLGGTFPILQGQFTPFQILMAMGLVKFVIEDVILRRTPLKLPSRVDLLMIAGFMAVITFHGIQDRFGMRFLGSTIWGGRNYVNVYVGLAAFFIIQSLPVTPKLWGKLPYAILAVSGFDLFVALVTTVLPGSIYVIFPFYSAVAASSLQEALGGEASAVTSRIGAFGNFGVLLITFVFAITSMRQILHPSNLFRILCVIGGALGVLFSGFRSSIFNSVLLLFAVGIRDLKKGVFALLPIVAAFLFGLSVVNSEFIALPKQIQRGLAFLPGDWDNEMARDVEASNDFRIQTWTLWWRQYFPDQPLLGRGFGFQGEWTKQSIYYASDFRQMVEVGNIHNGSLAALDTFGIVGTAFFVAWNVVLLMRALRVAFKGRGTEYVALRFIALILAVSILSYWIGAQSVGTFLPQQFALAGVFMFLQRNLKATQVSTRLEPPSAGPREFRRELVRV